MKQIVFFSLALLFAVSAFAQDEPESTDLSNLKAPSAPAFTILGINPEEIARPKTFKELETQLANSFANKGSFVLPNNLALEFQPYWLSSKDRLTYEQFVADSFKHRIIQNLSLSVGAAQLPGFKDTSNLNKRMGFGFRTYLLNGKPSAGQKQLAAITVALKRRADVTIKVVSLLKNITRNDSLCMMMAKSPSAINTYLESYMQSLSLLEKELFSLIAGNAIKAVEQGSAMSMEKVRAILEQQINDIKANGEEELQKLARKVSSTITDREGWFVECAGAMVLDFPFNDINRSYLPKYGMWVTATHRWVKDQKHRNYEALGMLRYMSNEIPVKQSSNFDVGVKLVWQKKNLSVTGEWIYRQQHAVLSTTTDATSGITTTISQNRDDYKLVANINYRLSDNLILTYTMGKGFEINTEVGNNLISAVGLNFGLGGLSTNSIK